MSIQDQAISVLHLTADGSQLAAKDLQLVQSALGNGLSEAGEAAMATLHSKVVSGEYFSEPQWLHGIPHVTKDHEGYVYWRGQRVEHYSFHDADRERAAAESLSENCLRLEAIGFPVNSRTVLDDACKDAPADTPWKLALQRYYSFFSDGERVLGIFYRAPGQTFSPGCFVLELREGRKVVTDLDGAYEAFHYLQDQGFVSMGAQPGYAEVVSRLERLGVSAAELDVELSLPDPSKLPF